MKTVELRKYYNTLSELNNSFTHYSLVWNQFNLDYDEVLNKNPETLTKDYFINNPFKRKYNIKFKELEIEHDKTHTTLIKGIFLLIYTHFESYLKELLLFAQLIDDSIEPLESKIENPDIQDFLLIDKVFNRIGINKDSLKEETKITLDYIRLKRNRLIHSNADNISKSLNDIIKKDEDDLNNYWNNILPSKLQGIDFSSKENANILSFNIIIDIINIFRGVSAEIDNLIIESLTEVKIVEKLIIPEFKELQKRKINNIKQERILSKFKNFCEAKYALIINDNIQEILKSSIA